MGKYPGTNIFWTFDKIDRPTKAAYHKTKSSLNHSCWPTTLLLLMSGQHGLVEKQLSTTFHQKYRSPKKLSGDGLYQDAAARYKHTSLSLGTKVGTKEEFVKTKV